jgi:hypothetical protein
MTPATLFSNGISAELCAVKAESEFADLTVMVCWPSGERASAVVRLVPDRSTHRYLPAGAFTIQDVATGRMIGLPEAAELLNRLDRDLYVKTRQGQ